MRQKKFVVKDLPISDYAAEGKSIGRLEGKVIFATGAVPGDVVDVFVTKNKKDWAEGKAIRFSSFSADRVEPFCIHFGTCGGCKWQMLPYNKQLQYKQQEAEQVLKRIGKVALPGVSPIIGSDDTVHYRNKLEFTFSNRRYLTNDEIKNAGEITQEDALGYHAPGIFDKIIDIKECWLMDDINNKIRNTVRKYAEDNRVTYYDIKEHTGFLRNIIVRYCTTGELMVNMVFGQDDRESMKMIKKILDHLLENIPSISTLLFTINKKWNDSIYDLEPQVHYGKGYITEMLGEFRFKISPKSFFQTNTRQAEKLYQVAADFAGLTGSEVLYDLYCGTGSIGIFLSKHSKKIIGVDVVEESITDAKENALLNNIEHAEFFAGDVIQICNAEFFKQHGHPEVVITDPPRAGMHEKLIQKLLEIEAPKIVYVIIIFWDPTCSHCQQEVPQLDSMFRAKWKKQGVKIYGVLSENEKEKWAAFIREHNLKDWVHVYQTPETAKAIADAQRAGYKQLYDITQTPTLYLLDKEKRIIAKKLTLQQMDEMLQTKIKNKTN